VLYVGVDAHKAVSQLTIMNGAGVVLSRKRVRSQREDIQAALSGYQELLKAVIEASYCWGPIYDWLEEVSDEVLLAHPAKVRAIAEARIKTDRLDSEILAHLLRTDLIPQAYAPSRELRALKRVLRQRLFLVRLRTMTKNRIRALLSQHAVTLPEKSKLFGGRGLAWLEALRLPEPDGTLLDEHLALLKFVAGQIASTEALIARLAQSDPAIEWLQSIPGIGPFFSVLIRWEVDNIQRFSSAKKFAGYTGLVPSTYASGGQVRHGGLTHQGNKWVRWALIEAVTAATMHSPGLRRFYLKMRGRRGAKDARTATARKLAELVWTIWTQRRCYMER
jgi:transposase